MVPATTRAYGIALAIEAVTGTRPQVIDAGAGRVAVVLAPGNQKVIRSLVNDTLTPGPRKSDIEIRGLLPAVLPPLAVRLLPVAAALLLAGILIGRTLK